MSFIIDDADTMFNKIMELRKKDPLPHEQKRDSRGRLICPECSNNRQQGGKDPSLFCKTCVEHTFSGPRLKEEYR